MMTTRFWSASVSSARKKPAQFSLGTESLTITNIALDKSCQIAGDAAAFVEVKLREAKPVTICSLGGVGGTLQACVNVKFSPADYPVQIGVSGGGTVHLSGMLFIHPPVLYPYKCFQGV
jgi:hypothetical protein